MRINNPYLQIFLSILAIAIVFLVSLIPNFIQILVTLILANCFYISFIFGGVFFIFNFIYFYNQKLEMEVSSYEKVVMTIFKECIMKPFTYSAGFYTSLIILKLNVIDYIYISEKYSAYDRIFMIGAMILLLIYITGKAILIIKKQIDLWRLHISKYKEGGTNVNT